MRTASRVAAALLAWAVAAGAASADARGQEIARRVDALEREGTSRMTVEMRVRPEGGGEERVFRISTSERENGDSHAVFEEPRTIRGLRILSAGSDSWVYFPSTGRVRKIAGSSRSGSVQGVGGDFSYEDLGSGDWSGSYAFDVVAEDPAAWTIRGAPTKPDPVYDLVELVVRKADDRPIKARFSSAKEGGFYKELDFLEYKSYGNRTVPSRMEMRNVKKGSSSLVKVIDAAFDVTLDPRLFDPTRFDK